jgi:glycosyltransferase involved in cell wall biosynthesis
LRILFVHRHLDVRGGGEKMLEILARELTRLGDEIYVVSMRKPDTHEWLTRFLKENPDRLYVLPEVTFGWLLPQVRLRWPRPTRYLNAIRETVLLRRVIARMNAHISVCMTGTLKGTALALLTVPPPRLVFPMGTLRRESPYDLIVKLMLKRRPTDVIITSESLMRELTEALGFEVHGAAHLIYGPYEDDFFRPMREKDESLICMTGRISPQKRFEFGILAAKEMKERNANFRLTIAGEVRSFGSAYYEYLRSLIESNGLQDNVNIIPKGEKAVLRDLCAKSLIYWNTSRGHFGLTNLEAVGCAAFPVVTPNLHEAIEVTGVGLVAHDVRDLAEKTLSLMSNPSRTRSLALEASKTVASRFGAAGYVPRFRQVLQEHCRCGK